MAERVHVNGIDHICIAVADVAKAEKDYERLFGWSAAYRYVDEAEKISVVGFMVGKTAIELMQDLDGTGETAKFIRKRGEGIMLMSYHVNDCAAALKTIEANGANLIDRQPRRFEPSGRNYAFIHPSSTHGVLTELIDGKYDIASADAKGRTS